MNEPTDGWMNKYTKDDLLQRETFPLDGMELTNQKLASK